MYAYAERCVIWNQCAFIIYLHKNILNISHYLYMGKTMHKRTVFWIDRRPRIRIQFHNNFFRLLKNFSKEIIQRLTTTHTCTYHFAFFSFLFLCFGFYHFLLCLSNFQTHYDYYCRRIEKPNCVIINKCFEIKYFIIHLSTEYRLYPHIALTFCQAMNLSQRFLTCMNDEFVCRISFNFVWLCLSVLLKAFKKQQPFILLFITSENVNAFRISPRINRWCVCMCIT